MAEAGRKEHARLKSFVMTIRAIVLSQRAVLAAKTLSPRGMSILPTTPIFLPQFPLMADRGMPWLTFRVQRGTES